MDGGLYKHWWLDGFNFGLYVADYTKAAGTLFGVKMQKLFTLRLGYRQRCLNF